MNPSNRILVVDDDAGIRSLVSSYLQKHGFQVDVASHPGEMRERLAQADYALIVLDVMMPGQDGLSALRQLQNIGAPPVIMLSAVGTDIDRIVGLEIGAEDYLAKPCNPRELLARIRTVLRRVSASVPVMPSAQQQAPDAAQADPGADDAPWYFAGWRLEPAPRLLYDPDGHLVAVSDGEFRLLRALVAHPRRVLTRDQLMGYAMGADADSYDRAIDVQISRLRRKLSRSGQPVELIRTVRNEGYIFVPAVTRTPAA